ncbi:uncharacterized protein TRUGW13939_08699 [Talaromyces rugulosus]|uniref:Uncharacterized protein n=1 Tax=Talaromyces rugulosus TaxID=121627 RepID=A0A7H8R5S0_TALRU|nr:uncharacterized protein TRUGW13939_08699 [Talaromyces rugulosus]QKX61547.1 hypothetical protein TRUGW13939_08699 [Talaromyces rugulosus]
MDPLTALSVAGSTIQFVDFGSRLVSKTQKLYKSADGVLTEHIHLEVIIADLGTLLKGLQRKLPEHRQLYNNQTVIEDDEALDNLCRRSVEIAEELMRRLEKLMISPRTRQGLDSENGEPECDVLKQQNQSALANLESSGKVDSLLMADRRQVTLEMFPEMDELSESVGGVMEQEEFRLLVLLRETLDHLSLQQSHLSNQLTQSTQLILTSFVNARDELASQIRDQSEKIIESQHARLYGKNPQQLEDFLKGKLGHTGSLQLPKGVKTSEEYVSGSSAHDYAVEDEIHTLITENGILGSLSFISLMDRRESVEIPYENTFEWIYEGLEGSRKPWNSFVDWLRQGSGIYWINGKAGSGKSTLMRYIYENDRTKQELKAWAGAMPSITCGFFFWKSGDEYQRSQSGLLRSLLFEILQRDRKLIPEAMPELKRCFRNLVDALRTKRVKVCLFIDGLDEYEGEYCDIVELFGGYANSPNLKICLSSRPLLVFEQAFANLPSLKLQDLTYGDISHYVKDRLYGHKYMVQLSKQNAADISSLVDEVVTKASGVFLWVKLVVRSLKMDSFYHDQASRIFQIVKVAHERSPGKLTLLKLYWAEEEDEMAAEIAPIQKYGDEELALACQVMDARLKSVCAGLLESYCPPFSDITPDAKVVYMHRTVTDWLAKPLVWDTIVSHSTENRIFSPTYAMLRSCVMQLKTAEVSVSLPLDMSIISDALYYAKASELDLNAGFPALLDQLDITASYHWRTGKAHIDNGHGILGGGKRRRKSSMSNCRPNMVAPDIDEFSARNARFPSKPFAEMDLELDLNPDNEDAFAEEEDELALCTTSEEGALHHWSYGLETPGIKPIGKGSTFYNLARDIGLSHYVSMKYDSAIIDDQDVNQHLLTHLSFNCTVPDPQLMERVLKAGTDPNFLYDGRPPWEGVLLAAASHFSRRAGSQRTGDSPENGPANGLRF